MIPMTLTEIAEVVGARIVGPDGGDARPEEGELVVDAPVVTDSREVTPGALYVARVGETTDGHRFVPAARDAGAVASLTTRPVEGAVCLVVDDVQEAFVALSRHVVDTLAAPERGSEALVVVGITGSSGKTSTKDLLAHVLRGSGETVAPVGSLNSEVGVPLTVCRVTGATRFLVVEMGARGIGHIEYLTRIAPPRIAAVLNVGTAHVGEFGSRANIARAKSEIVAALPSAADGGVAVLTADDDAVRAMSALTPAEVVLVGRAADADLRAIDVRLDDAARPSFTVVAGTEQVPVVLPLHGVHNVANALTVLAVARACGVDLAEAAARLRDAVPESRWRMEVSTTPGGVTVVNDAYNANPDSAAAALEALVAMSAGRRTWAVLGAMLELGDESDAEHARTGALARDLGVHRVVAVGETARPVADGAAGGGTETTWVPDVDAAEELIRRDTRPGDVVLLKSSRDAGLRFLGDRVTGRTDTAPTEAPSC